MNTIVKHGIMFNIKDGIPVTKDLEDTLELAAVKHLQTPVSVTPRNMPSPKYRFNFRVATRNEAASDPEKITIGINGVETEVLFPKGDPGIEESDLELIREMRTSPAYVSRIDGNLSIDFD